MTISIKAAKAKARRLQDKVRDRIRAMFPELEPDDVQSAPMGCNGADVKLSPAARRLFNYQVEAKARKAMAVVSDYEQCAGHGSAEPLLVVQCDRGKPLAVVSLDHFLDLFARANP